MYRNYKGPFRGSGQAQVKRCGALWIAECQIGKWKPLHDGSVVWRVVFDIVPGGQACAQAIGNRGAFVFWQGILHERIALRLKFVVVCIGKVHLFVFVDYSIKDHTTLY